ncbi:SDR family oxidoreductase [Chelativorans sp. Marseille-P2723]|uniref:SDR family oxidoreductase n=1 Tax=Chelativorans sp. Marseille-P2723 TaxID=2709133 RepID=UPI00156D7086|nr:SDR family oxidoreductase [Chelativorans sp. Marseille-P2723]
MKRKALIFGAGYSGRAIARELLPEFDLVAGTTRSCERASMLSREGIHPLIYDGNGFSGATRTILEETTHLIVTVGPGKEGEPVLADFERVLQSMPCLKWAAYLSTVGVYGDHGCAWVDEESECRPVSPRSLMRLEAEKAWMAFGRAQAVPVAVLRLPGIYGPGRNALDNLAAGTARRIVKPGQVFNRIHVDDIAGALHHLMNRNASGIFNIADDEPAPPQDVVAYAAKLAGLEPPPEIPFDEAQMTPMARSFYSECKRVSNTKLKASGYRLRYPHYRMGLEVLWQAKRKEWMPQICYDSR